MSQHKYNAVSDYSVITPHPTDPTIIPDIPLSQPLPSDVFHGGTVWKNLRLPPGVLPA